MPDLSDVAINPDSTIRQAVACMDGNGLFVALVLDEAGRLLDTITDGDVRRAILAGVGLDQPVAVLRERKAGGQYPTPVTASVNASATEWVELMEARHVKQLPLVDEEGRVLRVVALKDLIAVEDAPLRAVIMAGGLGTRLRPLTDDVPKPMLPVGDKPLLEYTLAQLKAAGIATVSVTTHYKSEVISEHFGDGSSFGVAINYLHEDEPLGTAGALGLLEKPTGPVLVINGDILSRIDFGAMLVFHREHSAEMTIGVRQFDFSIPFGVVEQDGVEIRRIVEKPVISRFVSAGVYLLNPDVVEMVPRGKPYDMPDLANLLAASGRRVVGFPIREYWLDIGKIEDYRRAQEDVHTISEVDA